MGLAESMLLGALAGGGAVIVYALVVRRHCPRCGARLPAFRLPTSGRQAFSGGWTCAKCGCEIDRRGRERTG